SSRNGRDSAGQRLGVKVGDGESISAGGIIVRQLGTQFAAGRGVGLGSDYTIYATITGTVKFDHESRVKKRVNVIASES
ncbi:MAG: 50S ribosomal protein L27, partial [Candidatus Limnocylindrus sp.]